MKNYDVVIIGSGIGGLVCGCYLAKSGFKVLIAEQHNKPGGYCTSFEKQGYRFDVGIHYLGGIKKGMLSRIINELQIKDLGFTQFDPSDKIIMPTATVNIRPKITHTIHEFRNAFPAEKDNIVRFFDLILKDDFLSIYSKMKKLNFKNVLDSYFMDTRLKSTLEVLLGNLGISAQRVSAISAILFFKEFISDPGWYPKNGIQAIPDSLVAYLRDRGGEILLTRKVKKILEENNKVSGVILADDAVIQSRVVVSNADITETFKKLLELNTRESRLLDDLEISTSLFSVYIGLKSSFQRELNDSATTWLFSTYNVEECYNNIKNPTIVKEKLKYLVCTFPFMHEHNGSAKPNLQLYMAAPFSTLQFWNKNRNVLMEKLINEAEKIIPGLKNNVQLSFNATPHTFCKYTSNREGAAYGWAAVPKLITKPIFFGKTSVKNLYLVGHWCNGGLSQGGIPQVAVSGRTIARLIVQNEGKKWEFKHNLLR